MKRAALIGAYLAAGLAVDSELGLHLRGQLVLGAVTWVVLLGCCVPLDGRTRAQVAGVVIFASVGEVTGSLLWGVYRYRLHNLPVFIPPGHGLVYLAGLSLARALRERPLVWLAGSGAVLWGLLGLTGALTRLDVAGAFGIPLLLFFLWRGRARATYAGVFLVVGCLELYGTALGTWRWAPTLPGLGVPDGNPPSGAASGYVWFDVMALFVAPWLLRAARAVRRTSRAEPTPAPATSVGK